VTPQQKDIVIRMLTESLQALSCPHAHARKIIAQHRDDIGRLRAQIVAEPTDEGAGLLLVHEAQLALWAAWKSATDAAQ